MMATTEATIPATIQAMAAVVSMFESDRSLGATFKLEDELVVVFAVRQVPILTHNDILKKH